MVAFSSANNLTGFNQVLRNAYFGFGLSQVILLEVEVQYTDPPFIWTNLVMIRENPPLDGEKCLAFDM